MADEMDESQLLQQEKSCRRDLISKKIQPDEYFCCILSLFGSDKTFTLFPSLINAISFTNPTLHRGLMDCYETFYAECEISSALGNANFSTSGNSKGNYTEHRSEVDADHDLELALKLSLEDYGSGGSDIYEPKEADLLDYAGWTGPGPGPGIPNSRESHTSKTKNVSLQHIPGNKPLVFNGGFSNSGCPKHSPSEVNNHDNFSTEKSKSEVYVPLNDAIAFNGSGSGMNAVVSKAQKQRNRRISAWGEKKSASRQNMPSSALGMSGSSNFVFEKQVKVENKPNLKSTTESAAAKFSNRNILSMLRFPDAKNRMPEMEQVPTSLTFTPRINGKNIISNQKQPIENTCPETLNRSGKKKNKRNKTGKGGVAVDRPISCKPVIYWIRRDLRIYDNPALFEASMSNSPVIPVFLWSEKEEGPEAAGGATKLWLHHALKSLNSSYQTRFQSQILFFKTSSCLEELRNLVYHSGAGTIVWNDLYEPCLKSRDDTICDSMKKSGVEVKRYHSYLLYEPSSVNMESIGMRGIGSVTHFMEACRQSTIESIRQPLEAPSGLPTPGTWPNSQPLDLIDLAKMPIRWNGDIIDWGAPMVASWDFSEDAAYDALQIFLSDGVKRYDKESGRADMTNTCKISPYLHFGQISPHTVLAEAKHRKCPKFLRKLAWRDLSYFLLHMFPTMDSVPMRPHYRLQRWSQRKDHVKAWQRGRTGYPLVDAAMRELWLSGWMNNYMRHVVASFLISYLHLHWIVGYKWFQDTLFDADVAINAMMWQNGGMSGLDHWNFVMHPVDAAMTCDPKGEYIRRWVPELAALPDEFIAQPWKCPPSILKRCGVVLGQTYPQRVITDLDKARDQSLEDAVDVRINHGAGWIDRHGNDMVPLPNGMKIPVITRKEFKYKTQNPDAEDNPHTAVLRGYRSRGRDELIAFENQVDFLASTMNECMQRNELKARASKYELIH